MASESQPVGRNRYGLTLEVELTMPIEGKAAQAAAHLLACDVFKHLKEVDWGYGIARVESVYAPMAQFDHGDFRPNDSEAVTSRG